MAEVQNNGGATGKGWKPGQSGNPGGRPKGIARQMRDAIKDDPTRVTRIFLDILEDPEAKDSDRIAAGREYLDRAYGKAPTYAPVDGENPLEIDSVARRIGAVLDELAERRAARSTGTSEGAELEGTGTG